MSLSTVGGKRRFPQSTTVALEIDKPRSLFVFHNHDLDFLYFELCKYTADFGHGLPIGEILRIEKTATKCQDA